MIKLWHDKRYYSLDYYLKNKFGKKIYKISLNGGMTCPNRDGSLGTKGCIFCSKGGSGDFASSPLLSIDDQIEEGKQLIKNKISRDSLTSNTIGDYIAYFQAYTNTYESVSYLRELYTKAILHPDIVALSIATRPDCLGDEIINLLKELNQIKPVWIELGLQTCHEKSVDFIRRGYALPVFEEAMQKLSKANIDTIIHLIIGLPGETKEDILKSVSYVSSFPIQGVKLQLLHVLKDTDLASYEFDTFTMDEYIDIIIKSLEIIPPNIVIHRLTGDGNKNELIKPLWSGNKKLVLNTINQELKKRDTWQGKHYIS